MPHRVKNIRRKYAKKRSSWRNRATAKGPGMARLSRRNNQLLTAKKPLGNYASISGSKQWNIGSVIPTEIMAMHTYSEYITLNTQGTAPATEIGTLIYYRLNSLYQPYFTSTAQQHQPYQYDQMRSLYNKSVVYGVRVQIRVQATTEQQNGVVVYVKNGTDVGNPTGEDLYVWEEKPNAWIVPTNAATNSVNPTRNFYFDIGEMFGKTRHEVLTEHDFESVGNSNPQSAMLIGFGLGNYAGLAGQVGLMLRFTYYVQWSEPVTNPNS